MKSVIAEIKPKEVYPALKKCAGENGDFIVFFYKDAKGFVVYSENPKRPIGYTYDFWVMDVFVPFHGTVALSNE